MSFLFDQKQVESNKRLSGLDHLRALAIILVFIWHYRQWDKPDWTNSLGNFGWTGVDLFFVLSGYLIGGQLLKKSAKGEKISLRKFYFSRFLRILPAYFVVLTLYFLIPGFKERDGLPPLWKFLTFTQNFGLDQHKYRAFSHAWSLCIEEQFYLLLPLFILAIISFNVLKKAIYIVLFLFVIGVFIRGYSWFHFVEPLTREDPNNDLRAAYFMWIYYPTYNRLDGLLTGICIASLFYFKPYLKETVTSKYGNMLLISSIAILTGSYFLCKDLYSFNASVFGFPLVSLGYGVLLLAALSPSCILYKHRWRLTEIIAILSYSIYLLHKQFINLTQSFFKHHGVEGSSTFMFWLCALSALAAASVLHLFIEKPFLRLRDKVLQRKNDKKEDLSTFQ